MAGVRVEEATSKSWVVVIEGRKPFAMGGDPMTRTEALKVARDIWATLKPETITVRRAR